MTVWILQEGDADGDSILSVSGSEARGLELANRWIDQNGGKAQWTTISTPLIYSMRWNGPDGKRLCLQPQPVIE